LTVYNYAQHINYKQISTTLWA